MADAPELPSPSFLGYTPVALAFGTSGLRGLVRDITDLETYINVKGTLAYLFREGDLRPGGGVVLAGDLRPSTDRIMRASAHAIADSGCTLENAGKIPTPALFLEATRSGRAGVMVTGSHIPFDRNGIKINKTAGEVLKSDEAGIGFEVTRVRAEEYAKTAASSAFGSDGMLKRAAPLPPVDGAAEERYVARYTQAFPRGGLAGKRILVYQHSAVGRDLVPRILRELGAVVTTGGRSAEFIPIDTENITDDELDRLEALLGPAEQEVGPVDAIVSTDGDSDRPLVVAVLPIAAGRRVRFLPGDLLGTVTAEYVKADAAAVPISVNDAVERSLRARQVTVETTRIGSPYVVAAIDALKAAGDARVVGWEANGGFLVASDLVLPGGALPALPSRDSILPILANLFAAASAGISLAELWDRLPARRGRAGLIDDFPVATSQAIVAGLVPPYAMLGGLVTPSYESDLLPAARDLVQSFFTAEDGFGVPLRMNFLDGLRVWFDNGDIAHIRPSGNAPQLRIYANADTQARADQIVALGLREPDGILRRLQKAFS